MKNEKINSFQLCSLIPFITSSAFMGSGFLYLFHESEKSILISLILGLILSVPINMLMFKVFNKDPDETFIGKLKKNASQPIFYILSFLVIIATFAMGSIVLYRLVTFFETQFLTDLPKYFLSFLLSLLIFSIASKNMESLSRFSTFTFFICTFILIFNASSLIPYIETTNILPIIDTTKTNIILSSLVTAVLFSAPTFLLLIIPKNNIVDNKKLKKHMTLFYTYSAVTLLIISFITLSSLGIEVIKIYTYPVYIVLKKIHVFDFINSIENITILFWFFYLIVSSSLAFMFSKNAICEVFKIEKSSKKNIVLGIILLTGILLPIYLFENISALDKPDIVDLPLIVYGIFIFVSFIYLILQKIKNMKKWDINGR